MCMDPSLVDANRTYHFVVHVHRCLCLKGANVYNDLFQSGPWKMYLKYTIYMHRCPPLKTEGYSGFLEIN